MIILVLTRHSRLLRLFFMDRPQSRRDWNDLNDEDPSVEVGTQTAAGQPSNADYLATINKALQIIELHCQKPRTISLDAMVPTPASVAPQIGLHSFNSGQRELRKRIGMVMARLLPK